MNNSLKELIFSLTKSEKRYFKLNSAISKTNFQLIELFDLVEKEKIISKTKLINQLQLKSKYNLAVLATRLQQLILKHLRGFHAHTSQTIELNNLIIEIEILYNKRLYNNCKRLINKAKKIAEFQENHLAMLSALKWESFIEKEEGKYLKQSQNTIKDIHKQEEKIIDEYKLVTNYKYHTFNLLLLSKNKALSSLNKELKKYDKLINSGYFEFKPDFTFDKKLYILNFKGMYFMSKGEYTNSLPQYTQLIDLFEHSHRTNILQSNEYFLALNNFLLLQVMNNKFDDYKLTLEKIYQQFGKLEAYKHSLFSITQNYELGIYCEIGEAKKGLIILPDIEKKLELYKKDMNEINKLLFYLNIAIMYFFNKNYRKSIFWLNKYLNDYSIKKDNVASNIFYYSHIINLVVHFEAKNYDTIDYLYKESIRNLKKIRKINRFDNEVLKFIKKNAEEQITSRKELRTRIQHLKKRLTAITKDKNQTTALQFFDFFAWIDSHITNKEMADIIKNKRLN